MSPSDNTVIHLKFRGPHVEDDTMAFSACKCCRNKTFTLTHDKPDDFPLMRCAACGAHIGRMGWAHDDDEPEQQKPVDEPQQVRRGLVRFEPCDDEPIL